MSPKAARRVIKLRLVLLGIIIAAAWFSIMRTSISPNHPWMLDTILLNTLFYCGIPVVLLTVWLDVLGRINRRYYLLCDISYLSPGEEYPESFIIGPFRSREKQLEWIETFWYSPSMERLYEDTYLRRTKSFPYARVRFNLDVPKEAELPTEQALPNDLAAHILRKSRT